MRPNKLQVTVITVLNVVIVALVAFILFPPGTFSDVSGENVQPDEPADAPPAIVHEKFRDASEGVVPEIERETKLMGNGDETVVRACFFGGNTYIFGNASVSGLDFDSYGGFLCIIDDKGKITSYSYFGAKLSAVGILPDSYAAAAGGKIYAVSHTGECVPVAELESGEEVVDIFSTVTGVAVVTQPTKTSLRLIEYAVSTDGWIAGSSTRIDKGLDLGYLGCYEFDGYVLCARASMLPNYDALVIFTFRAGGDAIPHFYGGSGENLTTPYAVRPYEFGYMGLCVRGGVATVMSVDYKFSEFHTYSLGFTATSASLIYFDKKHYACFSHGDGATTFEIYGNMNRRDVTELDGKVLERILGGKYIARQKSAIDVVGESVVSLDISGKTVGGEMNGGAITIVVEADGGSALSKPTAGKDIYLIRVVN